MKKLGKYQALLDHKARHPLRLLRKLKGESPSRIYATFEKLGPKISALFLSPNNRAESLSSVDARTATTYSGDYDTEAAWTLIGFALHATELNAFLGLRTNYEQALLQGDLANAALVARQVEQTSGATLWGLESDLLLSELTSGLEGNRAFLAQIDFDTAPLARFFGEFYSRRCESNFGFANYRAWTHQQLHELGALQKGLQEWLAFRAGITSSFGVSDPGFLLWRESGFPIADRYLAFLRLLGQYSRPLRPNTRTAEALAIAASHVTDPRLQVLARIANPTLPIQASPLQDTILAIIERYTRGEYERARSDANAAVASHPWAFEPYELLAFSTVYSGPAQSSTLVDTTLGSRLQHATVTFLERTAASEPAARELEKIGAILDSASLGLQITSFVTSLSGPRNEALERAHAMSAQVLTPRFADALEGQRNKTGFLDAFSTRYPESVGTLLRKASLAGKKAPPEIPSSRGDRYTAIGLARRGEYSSAADMFAVLLSEAGNAREHEGALTGLFEARIAGGHLDDCVRLVVNNWFGRWQPSTRRLDLQKVDPHRVSAATRGTMDWPLYVLICQEIGLPLEEPRAVYEAFDDFLAAAGVARPSLLRHHAQFGERSERLVTFLSQVCTPANMNSGLRFGSTDALEEERIHVCQWLLEIDPENAPMYRSEIAELSRQATLRKALHRLQRGRVYVNTHGIRTSLPASFQERFSRYVQYSALQKTLRVRVSPQAANRALAISAETDPLEELIVVTDASLGQFIDLFSDIRERYLFNHKHGLDSYLSIRIRHGTLSGHLRAIFERHHLVTRKRAGAYLENTAWDAVLRDPSTRDQALTVFRDFSSAVDELIEEVKSEWIQIRSNDHPAGLFDYTFTESELLTTWLRLLAERDIETFLDEVFAELRVRTETNLQTVVTRISDQLLAKLVTLLDRLSSSLTSIDASLSHGSLAAEITRCRTGTQLGVKQLAEWFVGTDDASIPTFDLPLLLEAAEHTLRNTNPQLDIRLSRAIHGQAELPGTCFLPLNDALGQLLKNAADYSGLDCVDLVVEATAENNSLTLRVSNALGPSVDLQKLQEVAARVTKDRSSAPSAIVREGGTGFAKLWKLLETDLGMTAQTATLAAHVSAAPSFDVTVQLNLEVLRGSSANR